ncbi:MAG: filamentous hemagglutinin N-terminal domain-containing protein [Arcobacter sp.]|jgi:filamentous hemagglutinin family protein|uniref:two-partner secretion domain-containing protein n=1 Tax=Arcobacter sp. TaxID=1872629 RepID=UPI002A763D71|nr:filamentous hemagglutinin N-terminal domain-containing protein [Arcobacter sp.]MDY3205013.1 filamentous hemagglutinin N-terminal domain-containing protein [Arcobacter sp.]
MLNRYIDNFDYNSRFRILKGGKISLVVSALLGSAIIASAAPTGGTVTSGNATISSSGNTTNITQTTQKASINWQGFSINSNETVNFNQPNVNSITLNRVVGNERSVIDGALNANGQVWILNSNGVLFNKNAKVNTAGIVATTKDISDSDFQAGNYKFSGNSSASVVNLGTIEANESGYVALLANTVQNDGTIKAYKGTVHLTGASEATINLNGNSIVSLTVNKGVLDALVENKGAIIADGGKIYLTTNAVDEILKGVVNNTGVLEANSMDDVMGHVEVFAHGGTANVSGEIKAEGGFVETSGKNVKIADDVKISTKSKTGKTGTWLIDPTDFTISSGNDTQTTSGIGATTLSTQASSNNITIQTQSTGTESGDINVNADVTWSTNKLTLEAHGNININANLNAHTNASLDMKTGYDGTDYTDSTKSVLVGMNPDGTFKGKVSFYTDAGTTARGGAGFLSINGNDYTVINALGASNTDVTTGKLTSIGTTGYYALGADIDASATATTGIWNYSYGGYSPFYGFKPLAGGSDSSSFSGVFNGLGHTIDKLYIAQGYSDYYNYRRSTGLFTSLSGGGVLSNVGLTNLDMPSNGTNVGGLVGNITNGIVANSYVTTAANKFINGTNVGGLVGNLSGANSTIKNSWSNATVQGSTAGGLVGNITSGASITNSYALGKLENGNYQGGLVGSADNATITNSYASGNVGVNGYNYIGGLVGNVTNSNISNSYYGGTTINGSYYLGGLFGTYDLASNITNSYYNVNDTTIKGASGVVTLGGIYGDLYATWQTKNRASLSASLYFNTIDTDFYELATLDDLKESLAFVYQDGIKYKLTADLDLNDATTNLTGWNIARLKGTFDGNDKTLSNLNIDQNFNKDVGLFGKLDGATVSN